MNLNTDLIKKTLDEVKTSIKDICTKDNLTIEYFNPKINEIESNMNKLDTLNLFIDDEKFTKEICTLEIISDRILKNQFEFLENESFRDSQIEFLNSMTLDKNNNDNEIKNIELEKELPNTEQPTKGIKESKEVLKDEIKNKHTKNMKSETEKIIDKINENLEKYFTNPNEMKKYLQYMSRFYQYSENNSMLIEGQFEGAMAVGSFKFWSNQGYKINKGEKGIKILTPATVTYFKDKNGEEKQLKYANKEEKLKIKNKEIDIHQRIFFKVGHVFDISQTNAPISDLPKIFPNKWLEGEVKDYDNFYKALEKMADKINFKIIEPKGELGAVKGVCYPKEKEIALNPRNSELQNVKTLLHELGHGKLHTMETRNNYSVNEKEYQAEMVAYSICSYFGLDTSEYSLSYLNSWTKNIDISERKEIIKEVKNTVSEFIESIENSLTNDISIDKKEKSVNEENIKNDAKEYTPQIIEDILKENYFKLKNICNDKNIIRDDLNDSVSIISNNLYNISESVQKLDTEEINKKYSYLDTVIDTIKANDIDFINDLSLRSSSIEILDNVFNKDIKESKPIDNTRENTDIYVKFNFSEHGEIKSNSIYKYEDANKLVGILTEMCVLDKNHMGYYKTDFEIHDNKKCDEKPFYSGRFDIGDGYAINLSNHIDRVVNEEFKNISQETKDSLFKKLGINTAYKEIQLDHAVSL